MSAERLCAREACGHPDHVHGTLENDCHAEDVNGEYCKCIGFLHPRAVPRFMAIPEEVGTPDACAQLAEILRETGAPVRWVEPAPASAPSASESTPTANYVQVVEGSFKAYPFDAEERGILARWAEKIKNGGGDLIVTPDKSQHALTVLRYEATLAAEVASLRASLGETQQLRAVVREFLAAMDGFDAAHVLDDEALDCWLTMKRCIAALRPLLATPHPSETQK